MYTMGLPSSSAVFGPGVFILSSHFFFLGGLFSFFLVESYVFASLPSSVYTPARRHWEFAEEAPAQDAPTYMIPL